jgi:alkylated DNA nucleotide flippase Atl1
MYVNTLSKIIKTDGHKSSKTMVNNLQTPWSTIVKTDGQKSSKTMVTHHQNHGQQSLKTMVTNHQNPRSQIAKNMDKHRQTPFANIINNHGQQLSNTMVANHQKPGCSILMHRVSNSSLFELVLRHPAMFFQVCHSSMFFREFSCSQEDALNEWKYLRSWYARRR